MKVGAQAAARRIARALLDVAESKGEGAALQGGLRQAAAALRDLPELRSALSNPALSVERRKRVVAAVFKGAPELLRRLLELLVAQDAVGLLPLVEQSYTHQWNERRGAITAQAVTATPLDPALERRLEEAIHKTTGLTAELRAEVDPAILGGVLLKMGGRTYDGTVRGRLRALRRTLKGQIGS
ncbi:MAG: ATP synthase F1 subunit delta [Acidobacteria bacterium]|nr:MAG: ATP synthase F1 subunit delta [Acidobacteriota bacterium]